MGTSIEDFAKEMSVLMPGLARIFLTRQSGMIEKSGDITVSQIAILHLLKDLPKCKMTEIARFLHVTTSAATGTVDRMVKAGFLRRAQEAGDRRIINIKLTQKGERTINTIFKEREKMMVDIFKHFTSREREAYLNTVKKMYGILTRGKR